MAPARPDSCSTCRANRRQRPCPPSGAACCPGPTATGGPKRSSRWPRRRPWPGRTERALVAALARDRLAELVDLAGSAHDLSPVAQLFLGLRQAGSDPMGASRALIAVLDADPEPWEHRLVRRLVPGLEVCAVIAPGVPAVMPAGREAIALLVSELLTATGRHLDAAALLDNLTADPGGGPRPRRRAPGERPPRAGGRRDRADGQHRRPQFAVPRGTRCRVAGGRPLRRRTGLPRPGDGRPRPPPGHHRGRAGGAGRPAPPRGRRPRRAGRHRPDHPPRRRRAGRGDRPDP